jgi:hypothetical protein
MRLNFAASRFLELLWIFALVRNVIHAPSACANCFARPMQVLIDPGQVMETTPRLQMQIKQETQMLQARVQFLDRQRRGSLR